MTSLDRGNLMEIHRQLLRLPANKQESTYLALNKEFHDLICAGARNNTITSTARDLRARLMPFRQTQRGTLKERIERSNEEHELIVNSIMSGDPESAYQAMVKHNARLSYGVLRMLREGSAPKA
jgi:DNA-binding GntR family transcriptional regulator